MKKYIKETEVIYFYDREQKIVNSLRLNDVAFAICVENQNTKIIGTERDIDTLSKYCDIYNYDYELLNCNELEFIASNGGRFAAWPYLEGVYEPNSMYKKLKEEENK